MSRIRSVHPGIFTDEAFMSASAYARLLTIGLWTEAWDDGAFEWKPVVLKARIFPADACDVAALLEELSALNVIKKVERNGKFYGLIRNFRRFQRPKKPNQSGIVLASDADFLGPEQDKEASVRNQFGTGSENPKQMEDGGWSKEEKKPSSLRSDGAEVAPPAPINPDFRTELFRRGLAAVVGSTGVPEPKARALLGQWLKEAQDEAVTVLVAIDAAVEARPADFVPWVRRAIQSRMSSRPPLRGQFQRRPTPHDQIAEFERMLTGERDHDGPTIDGRAYPAGRDDRREAFPMLPGLPE